MNIFRFLLFLDVCCKERDDDFQEFLLVMNEFSIDLLQVIRAKKTFMTSLLYLMVDKLHHAYY